MTIVSFQKLFRTILIGVNITIFCIAFFTTIRIFKYKGKVFLLLNISLICGIICSIIGLLDTMVSVFPVTLMVMLFSPFWIIMVQTTTWVYVLRIQTIQIHSQFEKYVNCVPWIIFLLQIPIIILFNISITLQQFEIETLVVGLIYDIVVITLEIYIFYVLMDKMLFLLEDKKEFKKEFIYEMTITIIFIIILDISLMLSLSFAEQPLIITVSTTSYLYRNFVVLRFYEILKSQQE